MAHLTQHHAHEVGKDGQPHGHHVMSAGALLFILVVLMAFTGLTVYTALEWKLGILGNAALALVIATFKATLVCMYFMHLKYDNHFYTVIFLACVCLFVTFLLFSMADLGTRDWMEPERAKLLVAVPEDKVGKARFADPLVAQGRQVFAANCASCHGAMGTGVASLGTALIVPDPGHAAGSFIAAPRVKAMSDAKLLELIRAGRAPTDPQSHSGLSKPPLAGNPKLTDEQIAAAVRFVRALGEPPHHGPSGGHGEDAHAPPAAAHGAPAAPSAAEPKPAEAKPAH